MPPSASRRKPKQAKKTRTLTPLPNHHSSPAVQLQGNCDLNKEENGSLTPVWESYPFVVVEEEKSKIKGHSLSTGVAVPANHSKMEGQDTQKVESLRQDKEVVVEVAAEDGDSAITDDEQATQSEENRELVDPGKVGETEDVSESVVDSLEPIVSSPNDLSDAIKAVPVDNTLASDTVELELKEEQEKDFLSPQPEETDVANHGVKETELLPSEDNNELSSVSGNEGLRETEVVETIKDMAVAEEEKNVLSSVVTDVLLRESEEPNKIYNGTSLPPTDVASKETLETTIPKSDESEKVPPTTTEEVPKAIEKSWVASTDEKVGEPSDVQESSYESAKESFQPSANVPDAESTSATVQDQTELPRSTENPTIVPVTQRQHTSWRSCCGLFEILMGGDR